MNRHYLREQDFEPDAEGSADDEAEPTLDISPQMRAVVIFIGVPLAFIFALCCWYGFYRFGKFLYDLALSA